MSYRTCDHLMEDGVFCSSPALRNQRFCYFHLDLRARRVQMAQARRKGESCRLRLPILDNMHAVQAALQQVGDALADDRIDIRRANALLYMLQQAAANLNNTRTWEGRRPQVELAEPFRSLEAPDLAEEYDLPANVDLALPPEAALDAAEQPAVQPEPAQPGSAQPAKAKEPRRLERVPERAADEMDRYFHIPKDPHREVTQDELAYQLSRLQAEIEAEREAENDAPPRSGVSSVRPVSLHEEAADVA